MASQFVSVTSEEIIQINFLLAVDIYPAIYISIASHLHFVEKLLTFRNFQICARCEKDLKDNKHDSLHLGRKYARIFVLGHFHYVFLVAHSSP